MELSTLSLLLSIGGFFLPPLSIVGVVLGRKSLRQEGYSREARLAVIIGWVGIGLWAISCCLLSIFTLVPIIVATQQSTTEPWLVVTPPPLRATPPPASPGSGEGRLGIVCEDDAGAKVVGVIDGSVAQQAGIQEGDRIISVNSTGIVDCSQLKEIVNSFESNETIILGILREQGEIQRIDVVIR